MKAWEHFKSKDHPASLVRITGRGRQISEAFESAGKALTALVLKPEHVSPKHSLLLTCEARSFDYLFYDWMNLLIYELEFNHRAFSDFRVQFIGMRLIAKVYGEGIDPKRHLLNGSLRGANFSDLYVRLEGSFWEASCLIDTQGLERATA